MTDRTSASRDPVRALATALHFEMSDEWRDCDLCHARALNIIGTLGGWDFAVTPTPHRDSWVQGLMTGSAFEGRFDRGKAEAMFDEAWPSIMEDWRAAYREHVLMPTMRHVLGPPAHPYQEEE